MREFFIRLVILLAILTVPARAQVLTDPVLQQTILKALERIYGGAFPEAEGTIRQLRTRYPQHPVGPMLRAVQLYWQYIPLSQQPEAPRQYVQACEQALALAQKRLEKVPDDPEGVFFALTAHSYLALKQHNDEELMGAVNEARRAYGYMKQGFDLTGKNPEFYFTTGLYNYYVERYPMDHPIVKPLMWFFRDGNRPLGIRQMELGARRALFTRHETAYYLANLYLQSENDPQRAAGWLKPLIAQFPENPVFLMRYVESLLLMARFDEARQLLPRLQAMPRPFLGSATHFFLGYLAEKEAANDSAAAAHYRAALSQAYVLPYTKEYHAMAYAGLARVAARRNERSLARSYYQRALTMTDYTALRAEIKAFK